MLNPTWGNICKRTLKCIRYSANAKYNYSCQCHSGLPSRYMPSEYEWLQDYSKPDVIGKVSCVIVRDRDVRVRVIMQQGLMPEKCESHWLSLILMYWYSAIITAYWLAHKYWLFSIYAKLYVSSKSFMNNIPLYSHSSPLWLSSPM